MAIIHENLYQSDSLKNVDFSFYINKIIAQLFIAFDIDKERIKTKIRLSDVTLNINLAIPVGLIINELLTNSIKYAFPDNVEGEISIDFQNKDKNFILIISDNGIGFPEKIDLQRSNSLGLLLVNALTRQIKGNLEVIQEKGTKFILTFPHL
jgi:two-component sensor histidine kinase